MTPEEQICTWLRRDPDRMDALRLARAQALPDWWLAAGFVRNLVWDQVHAVSEPTPLNDIDLIYFDSILYSTFDSIRADKERDRQVERVLACSSTMPWSVKNQARMHHRNGDRPYRSCEDAVRHWVELETAVGVKLGSDDQLMLLAPFGTHRLFAKTITLNPLYAGWREDRRQEKQRDFDSRIQSKRWLQLWPELRVVDAVQA